MRKTLTLIISFFTCLSYAQTDFAAFKAKYISLRQAHKTDSALIVTKQLNELSLKELGDTSLVYLCSFRFIANVFFDVAIFDSAIYYVKKGNDLFEKQHKEWYPDYAWGLNNLAIYSADIDNYGEAEILYKKALEIWKKVVGVEHADYANCLSNLANLYLLTGEYGKAEPLVKQSVGIRKRIFGNQSAVYAYSLLQQANLSFRMGNYFLADKLWNEALNITANSEGEESTQYGIGLLNIAYLHYCQGDFASAEPKYKAALAIFKKNLGPESPNVAKTTMALANLYFDAKNYEAAEKLQMEAFEIRKKLYGTSHLEYANSLFNLARIHASQKDFKLAESQYLEALQIVKKILGQNHPDYTEYSDNLADLYTNSNRHQEALKILEDNFRSNVKRVSENFEWLSDAQREDYWQQEASFYETIFEFVTKLNPKVATASELAYNAALFSKSKLLESRISKENYYTDIEEQRSLLAEKRRHLIKLESDGSDDYTLLATLQKEADSLDVLLAQSWPAYAEQKRKLKITWEQVKENLQEGEAAIEFVRYQVHKDSVYHYQALLIRADEKHPILVSLCDEDALKKLTPGMSYSAYYPLLWKPMEEHLKGIKTIYYSPVGELMNIPLHAIYEAKSTGDKTINAPDSKRGSAILNERTETELNVKYLMDQYTLHQVTSTRYLALGLKAKEKEKLNPSIALAGGINYKYLPGQNIAAKSPKNELVNTRSNNASQQLTYLEGSKKEIEAIAEIMGKQGWQTLLLEQNQATEERIVKMEGKDAYCILHIATHGFAFPEAKGIDSTLSETSFRYNYRFNPNPMVRCGLLLSGSNWAWTGSDTLSKLGATQNGILTGLEVSQLNLRKTKLVVLSACQTGLGKIEGSEGTFGLKRGFKLAGVEQMIVSLWSVPDKETMELMKIFYEELAKSGNISGAFTNAQLQMRIKYPNNPNLWAGFVFVR